ncbi:Agglutinin-like protein 6, partial [Candida tropicalis]
MSYFGFAILLLALFTRVTPKEITGIFTSFDSLTYSDAGNYGYQGPGNPTWTATLGWSLDGSVASPGDTFTLIMPCVFKFTSSSTSVDLTADGVTYATCKLNNGEEFTTFSSMSCVVNSALTSDTQAFGTVTVPFSFNVGGTGSSVDLEDSTCFTAGTNTVTFKDGDNELSINAVFEKTTASVSDEIIFVRSVPSIGKLQQISIAKDCPSGYESGYMSIIIRDNSAVMDCSSTHIGITNDLNDWNQPTNSETFSYTESCSATNFTISFTDIEAGYRPFMDSFLTATANARFNVDYIYKYTCKNGDTVDKTNSRVYAPYINSNTDSNGAILVITTRTGTQSTTGVTTLPFD